MHKYLLLAALGGLFIFTGCKNSPKSISDLKGTTAEDSMMYYFGEMQANNYWQDAETDTLLRLEDARRDFMNGLRAGLDMDKDNEAYNKGLQLGVRLGIRIHEFEERYGVSLPKDIMVAAMANCLDEGNESFNIAEAQKGFYAIKDRYEFEASKKDINAAADNLVKSAKEQGFSRINDTLYVKTITPGNGRRFKLGDRLPVEVTASKLNGQELVTKQFPDSVTLGEGRLRPVITQAVLTMNDGQTCQFMTTPRTLLGKRLHTVYKLPADQPLIFTVKAGAGAGRGNVNLDTPIEVE